MKTNAERFTTHTVFQTANYKTNSNIQVINTYSFTKSRLNKSYLLLLIIIIISSALCEMSRLQNLHTL